MLEIHSNTTEIFFSSSFFTFIWMACSFIRFLLTTLLNCEYLSLSAVFKLLWFLMTFVLMLYFPFGLHISLISSSVGSLNNLESSLSLNYGKYTLIDFHQNWGTVEYYQYNYRLNWINFQTKIISLILLISQNPLKTSCYNWQS